ncbi:MAG TPA: hypothetical protein VHA80_01160 [Solirubrobacterales bacterium]|nr:hypothetical protein [Solirubrobacterales bacterium]
MARYEEILDDFNRVVVVVRFETEGREVTDYAVILLVKVAGCRRTVRVYDGAHGYNELHRYTRDGGKQTGKRFHSGSLGEGMRAAIDDVKSGYQKMIEGWER